jgi:multicomponent Na+:H+ antiporter subunit E
MKQGVVLFLHLALAWLLWSGHFEIDLLIYGLVCCLIVVGITKRLRVLDRESLPAYLGLRPFLSYVPWMVWEVIKANVSVARIILDRTLPIDPQLVRVRADQKTALTQVIYANSITLTPGTISLDVRTHRRMEEAHDLRENVESADDPARSGWPIIRGSILVHALTSEAAEAVVEGEMGRRVCSLEDRPATTASGQTGEGAS